MPRSLLLGLYAILIFSILTTISCGGYREGIVQIESHSYLHFTGANAENAIIQIDDGTPIDLSKYRLVEDGTQKRYAIGKQISIDIAPGKHRVRVSRNGIVVVDRLLLLNGGTTKEVYVP